VPLGRAARARIASIVDAWGRSAVGHTLLTDLGMTALGGTPADLARAVTRELEVWGSIVKAAGMVGCRLIAATTVWLPSSHT
jgi:hypothetical protein